MIKVLNCKICEGELQFVQLAGDRKHDWKAVCKKCQREGGKAKSQIMSNEEIAKIIAEFPQSKVVGYYPIIQKMIKAQKRDISRLKTQNQTKKIADLTKSFAQCLNAMKAENQRELANLKLGIRGSVFGKTNDTSTSKKTTAFHEQIDTVSDKKIKQVLIRRKE